MASILARSLIHGTYNRTSGNVFEDPPAKDEPTASCLGNVYARSLTATHCELVSLNTGRHVTKVDELEKILKTLQYLHRDLPGSFQLGVLPLMQMELIRKIVWLKQPKESGLGNAFP